MSRQLERLLKRRYVTRLPRYDFFLENGRYGHAPIRVFEHTQRPIPIPIRVLRALVSQPLVILDQAGRLENAAYTQWVAHADH